MLETYRAQTSARKGRHPLHTRYTLIILNAVALAALLTYGIAVRGVQAATDSAALAAMMDSDTSVQYTILTPPEVK